jgi:hypothetical protein
LAQYFDRYDLDGNALKQFAALSTGIFDLIISRLALIVPRSELSG